MSEVGVFDVVLIILLVGAAIVFGNHIFKISPAGKTGTGCGTCHGCGQCTSKEERAAKLKYRIEEKRRQRRLST